MRSRGKRPRDCLSVAGAAGTQRASRLVELVMKLQDGIATLGEIQRFFFLGIRIGWIHHVCADIEREIEWLSIDQDSIGGRGLRQRPASSQRAQSQVLIPGLLNQPLNCLGSCLVPVKVPACFLWRIPKIIKVAKLQGVDLVFA